MNQEHLDKAADYPGLGPHYFAAADIARKFMEQFEAEHFEPLAKKFADEFYTKALDALQVFLLGNTEANIQGYIWRGVDESVKALLSGQKWAIERYALGDRYNCDEIRAAVAKHVPVELQNARIADLEKEVERLKESLRITRGWP